MNAICNYDAFMRMKSFLTSKPYSKQNCYSTRYDANVGISSSVSRSICYLHLLFSAYVYYLMSIIILIFLFLLQFCLTSFPFYSYVPVLLYFPIPSFSPFLSSLLPVSPPRTFLRNFRRRGCNCKPFGAISINMLSKCTQPSARGQR